MCAYGSLPLLRTLPSSGFPTKKTLFPSIHTHHNHGKHRRQHEWRCLRPGSCRLLQGSRQHPTLTLRKYHGHVSVFTDRRCWRQFPLPPHMTLNDLSCALTVARWLEQCKAIFHRHHDDRSSFRSHQLSQTQIHPFQPRCEILMLWMGLCPCGSCRRYFRELIQ